LEFQAEILEIFLLFFVFLDMFILSQQASIANQFLAEMRDEQIQKDRLRFRKNLERLGEILAYEVSKTLTYKEQEVQTPLEKAKIQLPSDQVVLVAVLRAALPFYQGFLNFFDQAERLFEKMLDVTFKRLFGSGGFLFRNLNTTLFSLRVCNG
jgi:hypothetical protein